MAISPSLLSVATRKTLIAQALNRESSNNKNWTRQESTQQQGDSISKECKMSLIWWTRIIRHHQYCWQPHVLNHYRGPGPRSDGLRGQGPYFDVITSLPGYWVSVYSPQRWPHSCIELTLITGQPHHDPPPAPVNIAADHCADLRSQLTQWKQHQNKQTKKPAQVWKNQIL